MNLPQLQTPRKILMTADTVGGVWTYAVELVRALGEHDIDVVLATLGAPLTPEQRDEVRLLCNAHVFESSFKLEWMENPWDDVARSGEWLLDLERRLRPDVIHLNGYCAGALPFRGPKLIVGHSCVLSWWQTVRDEPAPAEWARYQQEVTRGLRAADMVIAPSQAMLAALEWHYGPLPLPEVIPNGRDPQAYSPLPKEDFVFMAGRLWDDAKNLQALVRVAPALPWPVYAAGEFQRAPGSAHTQNVHLLGRLTPRALTTWFGRASIYALPARYEPFGLSALEAGLAGCALVLGDIPSLREIWGDAAVYVPPSEDKALEGTLRRLIGNPRERASLGQRARLRALEFTPERMAAAYVSAYSDLMMTAVPHGTEVLQSVA